MKFIQKSKYFVFGAVAVAVAVSIPLALKAVEMIPTSFKEGDIISASVINEILSRINTVQRGFESTDELNGTWTCKVYGTSMGDENMCTADGSMLKYKLATLTFNGTAKTYNWQNLMPFNSCSGSNTSGSYEVRGGMLLTRAGIYDIKMRSPSEFTWRGEAGEPGLAHCTKNEMPPAPVNQLVAAVSDKAVTLTWVDQSNDESGFKVQRKVLGSTDYVTVGVANANTATYADIVQNAGTYQYRVLSTNSYGDSISSSVIEVSVN